MKTSTETDTSPQFSTRNFPAESSPSPGLSVPGVADVPQSRERSSLLKHMTLFKVSGVSPFSHSVRRRTSSSLSSSPVSAEMRVLRVTGTVTLTSSSR